MKYMGSKARIAKYILPIMLKVAEEKGITTWVEPFVGGGNMIDKVPASFTRIGSDINPNTIFALKAIRDYVNELPDSCTEEEYKIHKKVNTDLLTMKQHSINSWLRFVASFGGKFDDGYAREKGSDAFTFVGYGKRNAQKQSPKLQDVTLLIQSYEDFKSDTKCVIYCDPPYKGATGYKNKFDHDRFWDWCRIQSDNGHEVFISEYNAPNDFECIWEKEIVTNFASQRTSATHKPTEKLFKYNNKKAL